MTKRISLTIISILLLNMQTFSQDIEGAWTGAIAVQGMQLHIVFNIKKTDNVLSATMDSPDQHAKDIPVTSVSFEKDSLVIAMEQIMGSYNGKFNKDSSAIIGTWRQGPGVFPLSLKKNVVLPKINRPQTPKPPFPYKEEEVSYENKEAKITLAGTLTLPLTDGKKIPAVIMITGSGKQDRDETILDHKPFAVIADYLTRQGVAVLRVDDRGAGKSTGDFSMATGKDFAGDVMTGIEFIKSRKEIDSKKIGLIGHSEGGIIAPMVAAQSNDVAFIVMMAGVGVNLFEVLKTQEALISKAAEIDDEIITRDTTLTENVHHILLITKDDAEAKKKIIALMKDEEMSEGKIEVAVAQFVNPWMRFYAFYNPADDLKKVKCPVLALNGSNDLQVPSEQNLPAIEKSLKEGGNKKYAIKEFPGLNHLFQHCETGAPSEYGSIEETISPDVLKIIGDWINATVKKL